MLKNKILLIIGLTLFFIQFYSQIILPINLQEAVKVLHINLPFLIAELLLLMSVAMFVIYIVINKKDKTQNTGYVKLSYLMIILSVVIFLGRAAVYCYLKFLIK